MSNGLVNYELLRKESWLTLTNHDVGMDMAQLRQALLANSSLRKLSLHAQFLASLDRPNVELLLDAIARVTTLQELWMALPSKNFLAPHEVLTHVLFHNNNNDNTTTSQLQKLAVRGMDDEACRVLARALSRPNASVTELQLRGAAHSSQRPVTRRGMEYVAQMLHVNTSLQRLDVVYDNGLDEQGCGALARALQSNATLQKLELKTNKLNNHHNNNSSNSATSNTRTTNPNADQRNHPQRAASSSSRTTTDNISTGYQAFVDMMHHNTTITHLHTSASPGTDEHTMMELLARLNGMGARTLFQQPYTATPQQMVRVLSKVQTNITAVYELLTLNPSLWLAMAQPHTCDAMEMEARTVASGTAISFHHPSTATGVRRLTKRNGVTIRQKAAALERTLGSSTTRSSSHHHDMIGSPARDHTMTQPPAGKRKRGSVLDRWNENIWAQSGRAAAQEYRSQRERRTLQQQQQQEQQQESTMRQQQVEHNSAETAVVVADHHRLQDEDQQVPRARRARPPPLSTLGLAFAVMLAAVCWSALATF